MRERAEGTSPGRKAMGHRKVFVIIIKTVLTSKPTQAAKHP